jgi:DNA-directed RNA polymerase subunit RPC12/RpoP
MKLVFCTVCRRQLDELPDLDFYERTPCPECASRARVYMEPVDVVKCQECGDPVSPLTYRENRGHCEKCLKNVSQGEKTPENKCNDQNCRC